ncbi:Uncharacterised protein [Vibrio cholerae]|nr:Uncharacterised protein [Vibrio cholerae]
MKTKSSVKMAPLVKVKIVATVAATTERYK